MSAWNWYIEWEFPNSGHLFEVKRCYVKIKSKYQNIEVIELARVGKALILDGKIQSSLLDEYVYHESLVQPAMVLHGNPRKVLILGGGEGATAREVLKFKTVEEVTMVDIDQSVIEVAKKYLEEWHQGAFEDKRLKLIIDDGYKFVEKSLKEGRKFDVIIADLADPTEGGPAYKLYTKEFYEMVKGILDKEGVFVTQATSLSYYSEVHAVIRNTLASIFRYVASYSVYIKSFDDEWGFVIASDAKDPKELNNEDIDGKLKELLVKENRFYDKESHLRMFSLPRYVRDTIKREKRIATLKNPVFLPV